MTNKEFKEFKRKKEPLENELSKANKEKECLWCWSEYYQIYKKYDDFHKVNNELITNKTLRETIEKEIDILNMEYGWKKR